MIRELWPQFFSRLWGQFIAFSIVAAIFDLWLYYGLHWNKEFLGLIALEVAVAAFVFDFRLHLDAEHLLRRTEKLQQTAEETASAATTRYIAQWPAHLKDLAKLVSSTEEPDQLLILLDFFAYGHFTSPKAYKTYFDAIKVAALDKKVTLRILLCNEEDARKCTEAQFEEKDFGDLKKEERFKLWLDHYKDILQGYQPEIYRDFIDTLLYISNHYCLQLVTLPRVLALPRDIEIRKMPDNTGETTTSWMRDVIYSWIIPDREMIFSFPRFYGAGSGYSFQTRDRKLLEELQKRFHQRWNNNATPVTEHIYQNCFARVSAKIKELEKMFVPEARHSIPMAKSEKSGA